MKIIDIKDLVKKDVPIHYRNEYTAYAVFETPEEIQLEKKISFVIERLAVGGIEVKVKLLEDIGYPLIPAIKAIKGRILAMDEEGLLL